MGQYSVWLQSISVFFVVVILKNEHQSVFCISSISSSSSNLSSTTTSASHNNESQLCPHHQSRALLEFKQIFTINSDASSECIDYGQVSYPKTKLWNTSGSSDCCKWDGVGCNELTGDVVSLDLSCSQLQGPIDSNSTLFQLSHLHTLNLAGNDFSLSNGISHAFGGFTSLTHLNLSSSRFSGQIPSEISHLSKLVSLDLSCYYYYYYYGRVSFGPHNFKMLLQNLTQLSELFLDYVNIGSDFPKNMSSSFTSISLYSTNLYGKLPGNIFNLQNLKSLDLGYNYYLTGNVPEVINNSSVGSSLQMLDLSFNQLFGVVPDSIGHLKSLNYLDLTYCEFWGYIPKSLWNLTQITHLYLEGNNFNGEIPSTLSNLEKLTHLVLSHNKLEGQILASLTNLGKLRSLRLGSNNFNGQFPTLFFNNLTQLVTLDIPNNSFVGPIPPNSTELPNLQYLYLFQNSLNGALPSWLFTLPSLLYIDLGNNQLEGQIAESIYSPLRYIDLRDNQLHGSIPKSVWKLVNLRHLYLSSNNLSGVVKLEMFLNLKELKQLDLSNNADLSFNFSTTDNTSLPNLQTVGLASCKITEFPNFLRYSENLNQLNLSNNNIEGQIPKWAWTMWRDSLSYLDLSHNFLTSLQPEIPWKNLFFLDLRSNLLQGPLLIPSSVSLRYFFMSNNKLTGEISSSICKLNNLEIIDLSNNSLTGVIPQCLANFSNVLKVLDLRMNRFLGIIPDTFLKGNKLRNLDLNGNQLEGRLPLSLGNCTQLEVLDLGNNNITDTFPQWLASLSNLQVLVFKSNSLHGPITTSHTNLLFPKLRIIDLSHNEFTGHLPEKYFKNFKAMMNVDEGKMELKYMGNWYYKDSVRVMFKGLDIELVSILTIFTTIDLSSNKFTGEIPKIIGDLNSLVLLNLSHNNLTGHIPSYMGNMAQLESLDLSANQLVGEIPGQLTSLTSLEVLNLSQNHLEGQIPRGNQFNTFENDSYGGNLALCGFPLSKSCSNDKPPPPPPPMVFPHEDDSDFFSGFTWESIVMGCGCGMVFGLVMGCTMFLVGKPKWFVGIVEREQHKRGKRSKKTAGRGCVGRRM